LQNANLSIRSRRFRLVARSTSEEVVELLASFGIKEEEQSRVYSR